MAKPPPDNRRSITSVSPASFAKEPISDDR
jgi:hypothetical protein